MSVFVRRGKFVVDYWPQGRKGKRVRKTLPAAITSIKEARAIERELREAVRDPEIHAPVNATVGELFPQYLDWYELHRAEKTYRDIKYCSQPITRHIGKIVAAEINSHHINIYKRLRKAEYRGNVKNTEVPIGNRTIIKELAYFSGFLRWCHKNIKGFPKRTFEIDGLPYKRPIPSVLSMEEAILFIQSAEPFYRVLFLVLFSLGLRLKEARLLKWIDIDFGTRTLKIIKKGGKENVLPLSDWLYGELTDLKKKSKSQWVFPSPSKWKKDQPVQDVRPAIKRACEKAEITKRVHPHLLRHSFATHLLDKNINLRTVQEMLGHADITTTQFYTQVVTKNKRQALSRAGLNLKPAVGVYAECPSDKASSRMCLRKDSQKPRKIRNSKDRPQDS
jgi:site-specific recombinase XerD